MKTPFFNIWFYKIKKDWYVFFKHSIWKVRLR